jgi:hypothetical protein
MDMTERILVIGDGCAPHRARLSIGALAAVVAATMAGAATVATAQVASPAAGASTPAAAVASSEINTFLVDSERASLTAALERASRDPTGAQTEWLDSRTRASGTIRPLGNVAGANGSAYGGYGGYGGNGGNDNGSACRAYDITVNVPARTTMQWNTNVGTAGNIAVGERTMPLSPAFTRQFTTQVCPPSNGALPSVPTRRR